MTERAEFAGRRKKLMQQLSETSIVVLPAAPICYRNAESEYPYRQNSDFYYLTGFTEPEAVAVFIPGRKNGEFILFNRPRNRAEETWTGHRAGQDGARHFFGADEAFPIADFPKKLPELLEGRKELYYTLGADTAFDTILLNAINKIRGKIRGGLYPPLEFIDIVSTIHEMRLIKDAHEIDLMRKAAEISAAAHVRVMQICKPGMNEYQLEAELMYEFQRNDARFPAYTPIVGSGENSCILHYVANNKMIQPGSMVLVDAGCEYGNYASDVTRTFPANGTFSAEQKAVYEIVLAAQQAGIATVRPGESWDAAQQKIVEIITQGLLDLGILKGTLVELMERQAYLPFYMHKSGHWLGLDVHDVGWYKVNGDWRSLKPGMVLTVEPGIYISADFSEVDARWHNIGIRIEDDILVTSEGHENLSRNVPTGIEDIEATMKST